MHAHDYVLEYPHRRIRGIDMYPFLSNTSSTQETDVMSYRGTGSTAIYPLLGCKLEPEWDFVATGTIHSPLNQTRLH